MKVGLFVPCYVDALFPQVGVASYKLLKRLGVDVEYPKGQTCCGQPMANGGVEKDAVGLALKMEKLFAGYDYVVAPSVSCTAFVRMHYPELLSHECHLADACLDIVEFLHDILRPTALPGSFEHKVSIHNSCHGVRELGLSSPSEQNVAPFNKIRDLLELKQGIQVVEPERKDECCGFGGLFCVEESAVSARMGLDKVRRHIATGAEFVTGADCSCLMHQSRIARKNGLKIEFKHVAEILAAGL